MQLLRWKYQRICNWCILTSIGNGFSIEVIIWHIRVVSFEGIVCCRCTDTCHFHQNTKMIAALYSLCLIVSGFLSAAPHLSSMMITMCWRQWNSVIGRRLMVIMVWHNLSRRRLMVTMVWHKTMLQMEVKGLACQPCINSTFLHRSLFLQWWTHLSGLPPHRLFQE